MAAGLTLPALAWTPSPRLLEAFVGGFVQEKWLHHESWHLPRFGHSLLPCRVRIRSHLGLLGGHLAVRNTRDCTNPASGSQHAHGCLDTAGKPSGGDGRADGDSTEGLAGPGRGSERRKLHSPSSSFDSSSSSAQDWSVRSFGCTAQAHRSQS